MTGIGLSRLGRMPSCMVCVARTKWGFFVCTTVYGIIQSVNALSTLVEGIRFNRA
jgi:hypothetical protein